MRYWWVSGVPPIIWPVATRWGASSARRGRKLGSTYRSSTSAAGLMWVSASQTRQPALILTAPAQLVSEQAVEPAGVLAGHLLDDVDRQVLELLVDIAPRLRPHAIRVGVVRAPHQGLDAHLVDQLGADAVVLERRLALPTPILTRLPLQRQVLVLILVLEVHAIEDVGDPADAALAKGDPEVRVALEDRPPHEGGQDIRQRHLKEAQAAVHQGPLGEPRVLLAQLGRHRGEGVEVQRHADGVNGLPEGLPHRMPHRLH